MNALKRYYSKKERMNLFLTIFILIVFIVYSIYLISAQTDIVRILTLVTVLVFFSASLILKEVLNFLFQKAIYQLTVECDPFLGFETINLVRKWDLLKGYTISYVAFSSLVYIDTDNAQAILELFAPDNKLTKTGKDMILIKYYSIYKAYVILNNKTQMKKAYAELIKLKTFTAKGKKLSPLYAWFDIEAEYAFLTNDFKEASGILSKANITALNLRERAHHFYLCALVETEKGNIDEAKTMLTDVVAIANKMSIKEKSLHKIEELNHEKTQKTR